ncbi:hypothetical protein ABBQ38_001475 [Trebouxia sp. C0009 RCD-2024]
MANRPTGVDEAIKFIWNQPETILQSSEKQRLSAALAKETDVVAKRYFFAPLPEQWVGTLKELLAPTARLAEALLGEGPPSKKTKTGVADLDREEIAALINKKLPTASSYSKTTVGGWADSKYKTIRPCMNFHRQHTLQDQRTTPVALLDPILAQVAEDCEVAAPTEGDCNFTARVASAMSESFTKEGERMDKFWELLEHEYSVKFQRIEFGDAKTDGSLTHPKGGLVVNIEVKNEVGSGGGAIHVQNAAYAAKYAAGQAVVLRQVSTCPTLLIELAGPNMSLSGAVFSNVVVCDQLTPMVSLLWQPHSPLMLQAARCFAALRMALPRLLAYYDSVQSQALRQQLDFPYPTSFIASDGGGQAHLQYVQRLSGLCFKGVIQPHGQSVFIKFCRSYSFAAHQAMAAAGYAPALLGFEQLAQGWLLIVQQFVDAVSWDEIVDKPVESLKAAVHALHAAGFVHGDLRGCNILVAAGAVSLIDFEWAGIVGKATYPYFMNHVDIQWPDGASDGRLVTESHDLWWLSKLI